MASVKEFWRLTTCSKARLSQVYITLELSANCVKQSKINTKVNTLGAASQQQCTRTHLPCCHGRCAWVHLQTPLSTTLFYRFCSIRFPTVQVLKGITPWACSWGRLRHHYDHKRADWRARSKFLQWRHKSIAAKMGKVCWSLKELCLIITWFWWELISSMSLFGTYWSTLVSSGLS